jgi:hypothetical protein
MKQNYKDLLHLLCMPQTIKSRLDILCSNDLHLIYDITLSDQFDFIIHVEDL